MMYIGCRDLNVLSSLLPHLPGSSSEKNHGHRERCSPLERDLSPGAGRSAEPGTTHSPGLAKRSPRRAHRSPECALQNGCEEWRSPSIGRRGLRRTRVNGGGMGGCGAAAVLSPRGTEPFPERMGGRGRSQGREGRGMRSGGRGTPSRQACCAPDKLISRRVQVSRAPRNEAPPCRSCRP